MNMLDLLLDYLFLLNSQNFKTTVWMGNQTSVILGEKNILLQNDERFERTGFGSKKSFVAGYARDLPLIFVFKIDFSTY